MNALSWIRQSPGEWHGKSGDVVAATAVQIGSGPDAGKWRWHADIPSKYIGHRDGL